MRRFLVVTHVVLGLFGLLTAAFEPEALKYAKKTASCRAVQRSPSEDTVDIHIRYVDLNDSRPGNPTIIMVHGWPSVWSAWARQIEEFEKDHHVIVPNLRGFGDSTHPGDVRTSGSMSDIVGDLLCVLQKAGVHQAICMGHDWGSSVCYEAARSRPDIFIGVVGAVVPYTPAAGPFVRIADLTHLVPKLTYQLFIDNDLEGAVVELNTDIERSIRGTLRTVGSPPPDAFLTSNSTFLGAWDGIEIPPVPFLSPVEEKYYVNEIAKQGFANTLYFYTTENRHRTWELAHKQGNHTIAQPVLAIYPTKDPVADWELVHDLLGAAEFLPDLTVHTIEAAHWPHLEKPQEFNKLVHSWLQDRFQVQDAVPMRDIVDEL